MLNFPSILEVAVYFLSAFACCKKKAYMQIETVAKVDFLVKKHVFSLWLSTFAENVPTRWNLEGGNIAPLLP